MSSYIRDDIYYCGCCGEFYDLETNKRVEVSLEEISKFTPDFIKQVLKDREKIRRKKRKHRTAAKKPKGKGFTNPR